MREPKIKISEKIFDITLYVEDFESNRVSFNGEAKTVTMLIQENHFDFFREQLVTPTSIVYN